MVEVLTLRSGRRTLEFHLSEAAPALPAQKQQTVNRRAWLARAAGAPCLAGCAVQRTEEADRAGTCIVVGRGSACDLFLRRALKAATLLRGSFGEQV